MAGERERFAILRLVLVGLAVVLLACALKNLSAHFLRGTWLCPYLCPSAFRWRGADDLFGLSQLFRFQEWLMVSTHALVGRLVTDPWNLFGKLVVAPLAEEAIYRGPLYLARRYARSTGWWVAGAVLTVVFALSHGRSGIALLPLLVLGAFSLWLVAATGRFWPSVALHALYNFFFVSQMVYQTQWMSD